MVETKTKLQEIEEKMLDYGKLFFKDYAKEEISLKEFWEKFYDLSDKYDTIDSDGRKITEIKKHRSLIEVFLICNTYYNCTLEEFLKTIKQYELVGHYCGNIQRYVIAINGIHRKNWMLMARNRKISEFDNLTIEEFLALVE